MIEAEKTSANLSNTLDSLYNSILEVLPAFVEWKRTAIVPENQPIVDFLHERSNNYRRVGDPKYYAYDNVVDVFVKTDIIINSENCKYFKGVGPKISTHVKEFLCGNATPQTTHFSKS